MKKALLIVSVAVFGLSFGCGNPSVSTFTDTRDGKVYRIVEINGQVWMAENLNYAAEGSMCYGNKNALCAKYGRIYNWDAALKACPAGFHLPDNEEWDTLVNYAGGEETAGKKLKARSGWNSFRGESGNGTDIYGFSALSGCDSLYFRNLCGSVHWWSATEYDADFVWYWYMTHNYEGVGRDNYGASKTTPFFSVRCVADKEGEQ